MSLVELDPTQAPWLDLISSVPEATIFHHPVWLRNLGAAYGFRNLVLAEVSASGTVVAGMPLILVRRPSGPILVGLPFSDHCPPLARDPEVGERLALDLATWSREQRIPIELRGCPSSDPAGEGAPPATEGGWGHWHVETIGTRHLLPLTDGSEAAWKGLRGTLRNQVRQARRNRLRVHFSTTAEDMERFYRLHLATRRRQGVPVQPRRFMSALWKEVVEPGLGFTALVENEAGAAIAAALMLGWNGNLVEKFQASDASHWPAKGNQLLIWSLIEWACEQGYRSFDFGRTDTAHTSLQSFKAGWGAQELPLRYATVGRPVAGLSRPSRRGDLLGHLIRHSPAFVCQALGSLLYRYAA